MIDIATEEGAGEVRFLLNGSFSKFAEVDSEGYLLVAGIKVRAITNLALIPQKNELVVFTNYPGCFAFGDGVSTCANLKWQGKYFLNLTNALAFELVDNNPNTPASIMVGTGIQEAEIYIEEGLTYSDGESDYPIISTLSYPAKITLKLTVEAPQNTPTYLKPIGTVAIREPDGGSGGEKVSVGSGMNGFLIIEPAYSVESMVIAAFNPIYL